MRPREVPEKPIVGLLEQDLGLSTEGWKLEKVVCLGSSCVVDLLKFRQRLR